MVSDHANTEYSASTVRRRAQCQHVRQPAEPFAPTRMARLLKSPILILSVQLRSEQGPIMKCLKCGLINDESALQCVCGHRFVTHSTRADAMPDAVIYREGGDLRRALRAGRVGGVGSTV